MIELGRTIISRPATHDDYVAVRSACACGTCIGGSRDYPGPRCGPEFGYKWCPSSGTSLVQYAQYRTPPSFIHPGRSSMWQSQNCPPGRCRIHGHGACCQPHSHGFPCSHPPVSKAAQHTMRGNTALSVDEGRGRADLGSRPPPPEALREHKVGDPE